MKKILILTLPLMVMCFASCEKGNEEEWTDDSPIIQFKDPKFLEAALKGASFEEREDFGVHGEIDKNKDGQISEKEASVVHGLDIGEAGIRNLEEIKYFTNLIHLNCTFNELSTIDLSENNCLEELYCSNNQLTFLDVNKLSALKKLGCDNNQLKTLDVSNNTALIQLDCSNNQLSTLDLRNNTQLAELNCPYNKMTVLNINSPVLTTIWCSDNLIEALDVQSCIAVNRLDCSNNQISTIDLSKNTALTDLYCNGNKLVELDIHNSHLLVWLQCGQNQLQKLTLYSYHILPKDNIEQIQQEYGDIIEYVE